MAQVEIFVSEMDTNPETHEFEFNWEAEDFASEEVQRRLDYRVAHSPYLVSEEELGKWQAEEESLVIVRLNGASGDFVWRASIESRHFIFECIAWTESEARVGVIAGLEAHAKAHKLDSQWVPDMSADIDTAQFSIGAAYRDGKLISTKKE